MKWRQFRRSENVEDYTDIDKPVRGGPWADVFMSIAEMLKLAKSSLAKDAGADDVKKT